MKHRKQAHQQQWSLKRLSPLAKRKQQLTEVSIPIQSTVMVIVDLVFHHGGEWITDPKLLYSRNLVHKWESYDSDLLSFIDIVNEFNDKLGFVGVQQLIVSVPSGKYYEIEGDEGIRTLLSMVNNQFDVLNFFAVEDMQHNETEVDINVENTIQHNETEVDIDEAATDCSSYGSDCGSEDVSDYDSEELECFARDSKRSITDKLLDYKELDKSMTFKDIAEARRFMSLYSLANEKNLTLVKSDPKRIRYTCEKQCNFTCLISGERHCSGVKVKTLSGEHKCQPSFKNTRVNATTIAYYFKEKLQGNPKYKIKDMRVDLKAAFNINASNGKCKRAKKMILEQLEGSFTDDYKKLAGYLGAMKESNPGSDINLKVSRDALADGKRKFLRLYVCFDALKKGFRAGLRPLIGLDGTFLKGKAKGQLLSVVGQDSENHFYPIAWAVVDIETKVTWIWFLEQLQNSLLMNNGEGITLISDMQKGLIEVVHQVLPNDQHRFCARHIEANWRKKGKRSKEMIKVFWWAAWATYEQELNDHLETLKELSKEGKEQLLEYPIQTWCRVFFDTVCKNQKVENNFTESFNSWILDARHKPIIRMLEDIRIKVMEMLCDNEEEVKKWASEWSPKTMEMYNDFLIIADNCSLNFNGDHGFEVSEGSDKHIVDLQRKKCTCRVWDLTGIPCPHAIKAMLHMKLEPMNEIHWWYSKEAYLLSYHEKIQPIPGNKFWKIVPEEAMEPPDLVKLVGRPKVLRTRGKDEALKRQTEWAASRKGRIMTCSSCGVPGHNARGCSKHLEKSSGAGTSKKAAKTGKRLNKKDGEGTSKGKKSVKRKRSVVDEEEDEQPPGSPLGASVEDIQLSAPQPSQQSPEMLASRDDTMSNPMTKTRQSLFGHAFFKSLLGPLPSDPDFEYPRMEADLPLRPRDVAEHTSRILSRMQKPISTGTRQIKFMGDARGLSRPSGLYAPKG